VSTFLLEIVTPERKVYSQDVQMIVAKGSSGELGILPQHIPLVTQLRIAPLKVKLENNQEKYIAVNGGFMEVRKDKVVILAESAEMSDEIDLSRAQSSKERAEQRIAGKNAEIDLIRSENALRRALTRIEVSGKK
jgi:F-type H+-transporting ATPase subunit epsilon